MWHGLCIIIYFGFNAFVAFENCNASLHNLFNKVLLRFNQLYLRLKYIKLNYLAFLSLKWPFIEQHHNHIDLKLIPSTSININFLEINSWKKNNSPNSRIFNIKNQYSQTFFVSSPWKSGWNDGVLWMGLNLSIWFIMVSSRFLAMRINLLHTLGGRDFFFIVLM